MSDITAVFWDIGGVLLTNGWDHSARRRAVDNFNLDPAEFETRHRKLVAAFETRQITLQEYLDETVFHRPRPFAVEDFRKFMFAQSQECRKALQIAEEMAGAGRHFMAPINNCSFELNLYRIRRFDLRRCFNVFFSSCFLGMRKPSREIYVLALRFTQRRPQECLFLDACPENLDEPRALGMHVIHYQSPAQLREELRRSGVDFETAA